MQNPLSSLAPARRRLVLGMLVLVLAVAVAVVVAVVSGRDPAVQPVSQDHPGPVLLVPGYGGSTASLKVLQKALDAAGRDTRLVDPPGDGTGDLRDQAAHLGDVVDAVLDETGSASVDLVGYSAGGVVVRLYVADDGAARTRRVVTLASPHHGTDLAAQAGLLGQEACPAACQQLAPDSDVLRRLNAGDETPSGPTWAALWTQDDATVVPATSGELEGALSFSVQSVCPGLTVGHADAPRTPAVEAMVVGLLAHARLALPDPEVVCGA